MNDQTGRVLAALCGALLCSLCLPACTPEELLVSPDMATPTPDMSTPTATQFEQVAALMAKECAKSGCHGAASSFLPRIEGGEQATPAQVRAALEGVSSSGGVPLIVPNDPNGSQLWRRMSGAQQPFMPPPTGLPDPQVKLVEDWINAGASFQVSSVVTPDMGVVPDMAPDMNVTPDAFDEVVRILRGCALDGCHDAGAFTVPKIDGGRQATRAQVRAALEGVSSGREPATPLTQMIFWRIEGTSKGPRMPLGGQLSQADIDAYKAWLDAGANF